MYNFFIFFKVKGKGNGWNMNYERLGRKTRLSKQKIINILVDNKCLKITIQPKRAQNNNHKHQHNLACILTNSTKLLKKKSVTVMYISKN
jgi:hypothetical protein